MPRSLTMRAPRFDCEFRPGSATLRLREPLTFEGGRVEALEMLVDGLPSHVALDPRSPAAALRDRRSYLVDAEVAFTFEELRALASARQASLELNRHDDSALQVAAHDADGVFAFCCRLEAGGDFGLALRVSDVRHARGALRSTNERLRRLAASLGAQHLDPPWTIPTPLRRAVGAALALRGWRAPRATTETSVNVTKSAVRVRTLQLEEQTVATPSNWAERLANLGETDDPADPCRWINAEVWVLRANAHARAGHVEATIEAATQALALGGDQPELFTQACEHVARVGAADHVVRWVDASRLPTARRIGVLRACASAADTEATQEALSDAVAERGGSPTTLHGEELFWP